MKIISGLFLGMLLVGFVSASAQMSRGTIENALLEEENIGCEFTSMQDGIDTPMRFAMTFPSTPNVVPDVKGTDPNTEFSSDFNNDGFFFSTNSTDIFTIRLNIDYDLPSDEPRMFFYELFTGDVALNEVGNWKLTGQHFCKILEFNARPAPHVLTDEEIVVKIASYEKEQHEITHAKQDETNNMIAVIVIAVVTVGIAVFIILIVMKLSKSRDTANSILVSKQFGKQTEKFGDAVKFMQTMINYNDLKIENIGKKVEQGLRDIMIGVFHIKEDEKKSAFPKNIPPYPSTNDDKISAGMKILDVVKSTAQEIGILSKDLPKEETLYDKINKKTDTELYSDADSMCKEISKYHIDQEFKEKYDTVMKVLKDRQNKK